LTTQKLRHDPILFLKRNRRPQYPHQEINLVQRLFNPDQYQHGEDPEKE